MTSGDKYFRESAGVDFVDSAAHFNNSKEKVHMSPDRFIRYAEHTGLANLGFGITPLEQYKKKVLNPVVIRKYAERMQKGIKANTPYLEYNSDGKIFAHDGRHRAMAAKSLGATSIPVWIIKHKPLRFSSKK